MATLTGVAARWLVGLIDSNEGPHGRDQADAGVLTSNAAAADMVGPVQGSGDSAVGGGISKAGLVKEAVGNAGGLVPAIGAGGACSAIRAIAGVSAPLPVLGSGGRAAISLAGNRSCKEYVNPAACCSAFIWFSLMCSHYRQRCRWGFTHSCSAERLT